MHDTVLLIDDDPAVLSAVGAYLRQVGYDVTQAATGTAGLEAYERHGADAVVLDLVLPDVSGLDLLRQFRDADAAVILFTGHGDVATAVEALQLGAEDFLTKPVDMQHLTSALARTIAGVRLRDEVVRLKTQLSDRVTLQAFGVSRRMRSLAKEIELLAASDRTTILLTGESGTGKGWVARLIHQLSPRAVGPFVGVNCGGLQSTLLNSELFGHEKGAFTDAKESKRGLFEVADGGVIFLDEIGDLAPELQPKLLNVLESRAFRRVGGTTEISVDVRLITATNRDVEALVAQGAFRQDLYYRIGVAVVRLPPVRERSREDRLDLLQRLLAGLAEELPGAPAEIQPKALERLLEYAWPGNVREMRNVLEWAMIMGRGSSALQLSHLPLEIRKERRSGGRRAPLGTLEDVERDHVSRVLSHHRGNRTRAARDLGISRPTLIQKIKRYGLEK